MPNDDHKGKGRSRSVQRMTVECVMKIMKVATRSFGNNTARDKGLILSQLEDTHSSEGRKENK